MIDPPRPRRSGSPVRPDAGGYDWPAIAAIATVHILAGVGVCWIPPTPQLLGVCAASYGLRMFGVTGGFHRYFAHRAFKTSRPLAFALAFLGGAAAQCGALWWAGHHRDHHRFSDQPGDVHSPIQRGMLWAHIGWAMHKSAYATQWVNLPDWRGRPELEFLDRHHILPPILWGLALWAVGGLPWVVWGMLVATVGVWHGVFSINSLAHGFGTRRFATPDTSRNNALVAVLTLGEGWHNNHHHYQTAARHGWTWAEFDPTWWLLLVLERLGLIWQLRPVPERVWPGTAALASPPVDKPAESSDNP